MREAARRRVIRSCLASILTSDLTRSEIHELVLELQSGRLGYELAAVVRDLSIILRDEPEYHQSSEPDGPDPVELAYQFVQRRKLSKKALIDLMQELGLRPTRSAVSGSIKDLLAWCFQVGSQGQTSKLLNALGGAKQDPYLKGIVGRD